MDLLLPCQNRSFTQQRRRQHGLTGNESYDGVRTTNGCRLFQYAVADHVAAEMLSLSRLSMSVLFAARLGQGAVLEEGRWRGHATPLLQKGGVSPLLAAVVVGVAWSAWHLPRDIVIGLPERLGVATHLFLYLSAFALGAIASSILAAHFMDRIGGRLVPAIMVHGLGNDAIGFSGLATNHQALTPHHQITKAVPFLLLVALVIGIAGRQLGRELDLEPAAAGGGEVL